MSKWVESGKVRIPQSVEWVSTFEVVPGSTVFEEVTDLYADWDFQGGCVVELSNGSASEEIWTLQDFIANDEI